jgi:hypothetical protein
MTYQAEFTKAALDPTRTPPKDLRNPFGGMVGKRFDVYRNNIIIGLIQALETGFPTIRALVGDEFFKAMAGIFVRAHPPKDPRIATYGGTFPGFLSQFKPVAHLPYLPDVARLDLGMRQSYHAADVTVLNVAGHDPAKVMQFRPRMAPASLIFSSRFAVYDIWRMHHETDAPKPKPGAQDIMITRPEFDPMPHILPAGGFTFARYLKGKNTLEAAMTATLADTPTADIAKILNLFLTTGALTLDNA